MRGENGKRIYVSALRQKCFSASVLQGASGLRQYHLETVRQIGEHGVPIFNVWNITGGARSFDGIHSSMGVNLQKSQLLLNYIEERKARLASESIIERHAK